MYQSVRAPVSSLRVLYTVRHRTHLPLPQALLLPVGRGVEESDE